MRRIERLPEAIHSAVRSGVVLCDLATIVEELVFNCIDAGATEVSVAVGVGSCYIKVVDNGSGITRDGLMLLGERYATSKVDHLVVMDIGTISFDFQGETLCSISDVSLLEIVTKAPGKPNGYKKIMKNCKCLFFGISEDRRDVGTTVTVRDVFYNQPVRRKHMESSPKKVLDSIKMSVLRIALVHVNVSFKVVDVESANELLHTGPSRSPLSILLSNSKIENSGALFSLNVSDGVLKVSGYVSGPFEILYLKAIQYVYINSRFVCKGPIHRLMNQLAAKFDLLNSPKPTTGCQSEKRNRQQTCPTFILNLNCPRSYYDIINSERSRTSVEFKDWGPILTFIENCITHLWTENISHEQDKPVTFESGRKRSRKQKFQTSIDLCAPQLKKPSENYNNVRDWKECVSDHGKSLTKVSVPNRHRSEVDFVSDTDYLGRLCDGSLAGYGVTKNDESTYHQSPCSVFIPKHHHFMPYSSDKQEDDISSPELGDFLQKFDNDTHNISVRSGLTVDCLKFGGDIHIKQDMGNSFLRHCSYEKSLLHDRTSSANDERFDFGSDSLKIKKKWVDGDDSIIDETDLVVYERDMQCSRAPAFQESPMTQYDMHEASEFLMRDSANSSLAFRNIVPYSHKQFWKCNSTQRSSSPGWSPVAEEQIVGIKFSDDDDDCFCKNLVESNSEFDKVTSHGCLTRRKDDLTGNNLNTEESWYEQNCSFTNSLLDHKVCTEYKENGGFNWEDIEYSLSPNPFKRISETDWSPLVSRGEESHKIYVVPSLYDTPLAENECGRPDNRMQGTKFYRKKSSVRSHSAPPFYKGKKRFLDLSNSSTLLSARSNSQMICRTLFSTEPCNWNHSQLHAEARNLKFFEKSFDHYCSSQMERSVKDCSFDIGSCLERTPEVISVQNCTLKKKEQLINMESVECRDLKEIQDSLDFGQKWRNYCLLNVGDKVLHNNKDQDTILDISSDILHLTGHSLVPKSIDKTSLDDAKVLNQVDKKFIAVVAGRTLAMIDQHAADERIKLEEFRQKVLSGDMKTITYLDSERDLVLPEIGYQLLHYYAKQIQTWGWICNINSEDTSFFTKNLDFLHRQPTVVKLLAVPCILGANLTDIDLLEFLQQLADTDGSSTVPPSVHRILVNKACRGAIMFGDALLPSECSLIVQELKQTSLCFQCAHGRPTTVPLVNLNILHNKIATLGSHKSWHGLQRHELKLKRSAQRLHSAMC